MTTKPPKTVKLTKAFVDGLAPTITDRFVWDMADRGLGVRVWPSGRKSWVFKFEAAGKSRRITVGDAAAMSLEEARRRVRALRVQSDDGGQPVSPRRAARQAAEAAAAAAAVERRVADRPTVADLFDRFLSEQRSSTTAKEYTRLIGEPKVNQGPAKGQTRAGELRAALGAQYVDDVSFDHIHRLHTGMKARPILANRCVAILRACFKLAELLKWRPAHSNPCDGIEAYNEAERTRYLNPEEYQRVGQALETAVRDGLPLPPSIAKTRATERTNKHRAKSTAGRLAPANPVGIAALKMLLLTGWRSGEVLSLRWEYLHPDKGLARLPDTKTGASERYLGAAVWELLEEVERLHGRKQGFVFPGEKGQPFQGLKRLWSAVRHAADLNDVRLHDLRHATASVAVSAGMSLAIIGQLLGHKDLKSTARYAHLMDTAAKGAANDVTAQISGSLRPVVPESASPSPAKLLTFKSRKA